MNDGCLQERATDLDSDPRTVPWTPSNHEMTPTPDGEDGDQAVKAIREGVENVTVTLAL